MTLGSLLALLEVMQHTVGQAGPGQLDDALIALPLIVSINGKGQIAGAAETRQRRLLLLRQQAIQRRLVAVHVTAQGSVRIDIGHHETKRTVAADLQGEDPLILHHRREPAGKQQKLREQTGYRQGILVPAQYFAQGGP